MSGSIREQLEAAQAEVARLKFLNRVRRVPEYGELGGVIQRLRVSAGLRISDVAKKANVSTSQVSQIETGANQNPGLFSLCLIAEALATPLSVILKKWEDEQS